MWAWMGIADVKAAIGDMPLVAIGGIGRGRISAAVFDAGADSVAIIVALLCEPTEIESQAC